MQQPIFPTRFQSHSRPNVVLIVGRLLLSHNPSHHLLLFHTHIIHVLPE